MTNSTARLSDYQVVEIVKQSAKTSIVREITRYSAKNKRVKNAQLLADVFIPLNEETAKTATLILNIKHPEWGVKSFNYKGQELGEGRYTHTHGTGPNSAILFNDEMRFWRVIK